MVKTGRLRNGWEMDRKSATAQQGPRSWQQKAPNESLSAHSGLEGIRLIESVMQISGVWNSVDAPDAAGNFHQRKHKC